MHSASQRRKKVATGFFTLPSALAVSCVYCTVLYVICNNFADHTGGTEFHYNIRAEQTATVAQSDASVVLVCVSICICVCNFLLILCNRICACIRAEYQYFYLYVYISGKPAASVRWMNYKDGNLDFNQTTLM